MLFLKMAPMSAYVMALFSFRLADKLKNLLLLALAFIFGDTFNDSDSNSLTHITDSKSSKRRKVSERFDAKWLSGLKVDNACISSLDKLWVFFQNFSRTTIHLLLNESKFACNVGSVTIEDRGVSVGDLSGVVHDNDLCLEGANSGGRGCLGIGSDESTAKILDGNVLDVETNIVTRDGLGEGFVVHLNGLDFSNESSRGEHGMDTRLNDTSFHTSDRYSSDTTNLVNILKRKTKWLLGRTLRRSARVEGLEQVRSLVPRHVSGLFNHVITFPSRDRDERDLHGLVANLLEVGSNFSLDFLVTGLFVLDSLVVHLVEGDNHLLDSKRVSKKGVLTGLSILRNSSLETSLRGVNDKDSDISLGSSGDHVLDEITVSWGINDGERVLWGLELPESNVNSNTTLAFSLEVIQNPGILEGRLSEFGSFLLELFNGTLIDTSTLVDQVTSGGGLSGIDVTDDDQPVHKIRKWKSTGQS